MKPVFLIFLLVSCTQGIFGQNLSRDTGRLSPVQGKPPIDTSTFDKWLSVRPTWVDAKVVVSNDGNYTFYKIRESWRLPATLIIHGINGNWKMEFHNVENAVFTEDSRRAVFIQSGDSLCLLTLGSSTKEYIPHVGSFKFFKQGNAEWMVYQLNTDGKELVLYDPGTGREQSFPGVSEYLLSPDGNILVLKTESKQDSITKQSLSWVNLRDGKRKVIWEGRNAVNLVLDDDGMQLAFRVEENVSTLLTMTGGEEKSIWYYKAGADKAVQLANNQSAGIDKGLQLEGISKFSVDGSRLFILLTDLAVLKPKQNAVKIDVWSYTDAQLQSEQLNEVRWPKTYMASIHINDHRITRLQQHDDFVSATGNDDFLCMINRKGNDLESHWNAAAKSTSYLVASGNGERTALKVNIDKFLSFSPGGRWLVGLEETFNDFYSYEISKGIIRNLTKTLPIPLLKMIERDHLDRPLFKHSRGFWLGGWLDDGKVLIGDEYDIWQVDPEGKKEPVSLTNGYGRKNKIEFRLAGIYSDKTIPHTGTLIVRAFNKTNKNSGFYRIIMGKKADPQLLSMGPYQYDPGYDGAFQVKARDAEVYVVMRESATESPNYFWTKDFKSFIPLSTVYPEKNYNWFSSELVSFKTLDGRIEQAVLYKPANFDRRKKYPVIIHYYERKSQNLNKYYRPGEPNGELDIAWFVSHEYIVFTPDIHYRTGETGQSAFNSIDGAAKYLTQFSWVDSKHIGIQGHSFGGYETNYVVTKTKFFAAAVSSSGKCDFISSYGNWPGQAVNGQYFAEMWQNRLGATLWERPDSYIRNSPVFDADKVITPILTIANKKDANVPFTQGLEWFTALRRLGKKAWMLQYDEESHGLSGKNYKDYVIRMTQFFDHYLKGAPPPKWMTRGIPAKMKGIDDGLELDDKIKTPGQGLLMSK